MTQDKRAAVVTGAGRGIGRAIAFDLASRGHPVVLQARSEAQLKEVAAEIERGGGKAHVVVGDVTEPSAAEALVSRCETAFGAVHIAVACAGQAISAPLFKTSIEDFESLFRVNVLSAVHLMKAAGQAMVARKTQGRIIVVASTAAVRGMRFTSAYSASKHAVLGLVRSAALELARDGITVNAVCPGWVDTPMFEDTVNNIAAKTKCSLEQARAKITERIPLGSVLSPKEVATMVAYVASLEAAHLTGQALVVDGGESIA